MDNSQQTLSELTTYMKYAKYIPDQERRESWDELVTRNKDMHLKKFPELRHEIEDAYKFVYDKKVLPSMRSMQFAGKSIDINPTRIFNCAYLPIDDIHAFQEVMFLLLSGTGVGFGIQEHQVDQLSEIILPRTDRKRRWLIGDSIEGWADAVGILMKSYFKGGPKIVFDYSDIRAKGARLITSGGKAPGPQPLKECLIKIEGILEQKKHGDKLKPVEVHDIICHIADAVLAGGIRRAALISLFSEDDEEMISCKSGNWWELNPQRGRANNSAVIMRSDITEERFFDLWKRIELSGAGEPGLYFTNDKDLGTNPCISGDAMITVRDLDNPHPYRIPMSMLVDIFNSNSICPLILSYNIDRKIYEWKIIQAAFLTKQQTKVIQIEYQGNILRCTPDHKIFTKNRGWVEAQHLQESDVLVIDRGIQYE